MWGGGVGGLSLSSKITLKLLKLQYKIEISHFNMQLKQFFMRIKQHRRGEERGTEWEQKGAAITGESCETDSDSDRGRGEEEERETDWQTEETDRLSRDSR